MKKLKMWLTVAILIFAEVVESEAAVLKIAPPPSIINSPQSLEVVIVDKNGNAIKQTAYYNPTVGGIEADTRWAGPNASIYIPNWETGYIWQNGYWVDAEGYYWDGSRKTSIAMPDWRNQWVDYWHKYWHDKRGYWPRGRQDRADERKRFGRSYDKKQNEDAGLKGFGQTNPMPSTKMENTPMVPNRR